MASIAPIGKPAGGGGTGAGNVGPDMIYADRQAVTTMFEPEPPVGVTAAWTKPPPARTGSLTLPEEWPSSASMVKGVPGMPVRIGVDRDPDYFKL